MYKNILNLCALIFFMALAASFVSCEPEENETVQLSRLFRPSSFSRVVDGTNVSLKWMPIKNATYLIEYGHLASGLPFDSVKNKVVVELARGTTSYELSDLWGSTRYGIRIMAISTLAGTNNSEWVATNFTTGAENIFYPLTYQPDGSYFKILLSWQVEKEVSRIVVTNLQLGEKIFEISNEEKALGEKTLLGTTDYRFRNGQQYNITIWLGDRKRGENTITLQR